MFGLRVGYAADGIANEVKPHLPQATVAFCERNATADELVLRTGYDAKMAAFSKRKGMTDDTWAARVLKRLGKISALSGRDKLREALARLGFPLK